MDIGRYLCAPGVKQYLKGERWNTLWDRINNLDIKYELWLAWFNIELIMSYRNSHMEKEGGCILFFPHLSESVYIFFINTHKHSQT